MRSTVRIIWSFFRTSLFLFIGLILAHSAAFAIVRHSNGKIAFTSDRDGSSQIYVMNPDGTEQVRLTNNPFGDEFPTWSPDGRKIAFVGQDSSGRCFLGVMNADGTNQTQLTPLSFSMSADGAVQSGGSYISWSPDGRKIAFIDSTDPSRGMDIFTVNSDGTNRVNLTHGGYNWSPAWSSNGTRIMFNGNCGPNASLCFMKADGTDVTSFPSPTGLWDGDSDWSPTGKKIAFLEEDFYGLIDSIYTANADGSDRQVFLESCLDIVRNVGGCGTDRPKWSPDGRKIVFQDWETYVGGADFAVVIYVANSDGSGLSQLTSSTQKNFNPSWQPVTPAGFDFDGDGRSDISVFRPSDGKWYLDLSSAGLTSTQFGLSTDQITPADFDGDGKTDISVFRNGVWYWLNSSNGTLGVVQFGQAGDIPVPADYNGDGRDELAIYRNGDWWMLDLASNQTSVSNFGLATDRPVPADYDGDGKIDQAVYRDGQWHLNQSTLGYTVINFGLPSDKPVVADYDGDGKADPAVYREGTWYLNQSSQGFAAFNWGLSTDVPTPADYDGDGKADAAVFRSGTWYLLQSTSGMSIQQFGQASDDPTQAAFAR